MRTNRSLLALGLAILSIVTLAFAALLNSPDSAVSLSAAAIASALWIAAGAAFIEGAPARRRRWLRVSLLVFGIAFLLPSAITTGAGGDRQSFLGFQAFHLGLIFVPQVWLANPLYLAGLALARLGNPLPAAIAIGLGLVFGLSLGSVQPQIQPTIGYAVWLAGMALGGIAALVDRFGRRNAVSEPGS